MSKFVTVKGLSDSAAPPERLRATADLQAQIAGLSTQVHQLGNLLMEWTRAASEESQGQQQQTLDLGALIEPIPAAMSEILRRQRSQEEEIAKLSATLTRITAALPPFIEKPDGRRMQPRLASSKELASLPAAVWSARP